MAIRMAFKTPSMPALEYVADASTSFQLGALVYRDTSTGELKEATSSAGTVLNIEGIANKTETTAATNPKIRITPFLQNDLVIADCTANTAANQLNKAHAMTDALTINNTSSHVATTLGVFMAIAAVGEASNKKLLGYFIKVGQVTA